MYTIKCDGFPLLDLRDEDLYVINPRVKVEVNTVGEGSFTIYANHPHYDKLKKLKSVFEVADEFGVIFRGRMTTDTVDFYNGKAVDLEGAMAFFNDSIVRPYVFPDNFASNQEYIEAADSGNVIEYFLKWLIDNHNQQTSEHQHFKLGEVTVTDPNNYLARASTDYASTWETIKTTLFDSALGGYLCIRYEKDGNYIDYLKDFKYTNTQAIEFGANLLDLRHETNAATTYSAIIPKGAEIENEDGTKAIVMLSSLADGDVTDDIVKTGDTLYSRSAVEAYGWIYAPVSETTWEDVTIPENLRTKGVEFLSGTAVMLSDTLEVTGADLHYTEKEIRSFRIYKNIIVNSPPHGLSKTYKLTSLDIDLLNPQNTKIVCGETRKTLVESQSSESNTIIQKIESSTSAVTGNTTSIEELEKTIAEQYSTFTKTAEEITLGIVAGYTTTGEFEEYQRKAATLMATAEGFVANFETVNKVLTEHGEAISEQQKYIRLVNGEIHMGHSESPVTSVYTNDSLEFRYNGVTVATFTNEVLKVKSVSVENQVSYAGQWATRKGAYIEGVGYNLNDVWIGTKMEEPQFAVSYDGNGNLTVSGVTATYDGIGNVTVSGLSVTDDGNGNVIGG